MGSATKPGLTPARKISEAAGVDLANRLRSFRGHVWSQLRRLDGVVPATAVEIPDALQDMYRCDLCGDGTRSRRCRGAGKAWLQACRIPKLPPASEQ